MSNLGERIKKVRGNKSREEFANLFSVHRNTLAAWEKGYTSPSADFLKDVCEQCGVSSEWLLFGKADQSQQKANANIASPAALLSAEGQWGVPVIGMAETKTGGWYTQTQTAITTQRPAEYIGNSNLFVAMITGERMRPEGMRHGYLCYCDPRYPPNIDDAIYVELTNSKVSIKILAQTKGDILTLKDWLPPDEHGLQEPATEDVPMREIKMLATVIYVKRKL